jgi:hypothetical protein
MDTLRKLNYNCSCLLVKHNYTSHHCFKQAVMKVFAIAGLGKF